MNKNKVCIIAEAGVNHNGDVEIAKRLVDCAAEAGADIIKFQTFKAENLAIEKAEKANYQKNTTGGEETQFQMLKKLELTENMHDELIRHCNDKNIQFLSTPFDIESIHFLSNKDISLFKIPSGEITNLPYLREIGKQNKDVILSTGMSNMVEVNAAIEILQTYGAKKISLLHCSTEYPTPMQDVNLNAMISMKQETGLDVGYSDHTLGWEVSVAAVALGAKIIEKHFTLDKNMEGPDHKASLEPEELKRMVMAIRNIELAMGDNEKKISPSEIKNKDVARKSIVAKHYIHKGEILTEINLTTKRPGNGICPMEWDSIVGTFAKRDFDRDEMIEI